MHITVWDPQADRFLDADSGIHGALGFTRRELVGRGWVESGLLTREELTEGHTELGSGGSWTRFVRGHLMTATILSTGNVLALFTT